MCRTNHIHLDIAVRRTGTVVGAKNTTFDGSTQLGMPCLFWFTNVDQHIAFAIVLVVAYVCK